MYYTVLYCTVLYCTVLYYIYCTVLYCTVLYCTSLYCITMYFTIELLQYTIQCHSPSLQSGVSLLLPTPRPSLSRLLFTRDEATLRPWSDVGRPPTCHSPPSLWRGVCGTVSWESRCNVVTCNSGDSSVCICKINK